MWEALGLLGILSLWGALGFVSGSAVFIASRGRASLLLVPASLLVLPASVLAGMAGGALTPALGGKDAFGFGISLAAALAMGSAASVLILRWPQMRTDGHR